MIVIQNDTLTPSHSLLSCRYLSLFLTLSYFQCSCTYFVSMFYCVFLCCCYYLNKFIFLRIITHASKAYILKEAISDELLRVFIFIILYIFSFCISHHCSENTITIEIEIFSCCYFYF